MHFQERNHRGNNPSESLKQINPKLCNMWEKKNAAQLETFMEMFAGGAFEDFQNLGYFYIKLYQEKDKILKNLRDTFL